MLVGILAFLVGFLFYYVSNQSEKDPEFLGDDIEFEGGAIILMIAGIIVILCDIFDLWIFE